MIRNWLIIALLIGLGITMRGNLSLQEDLSKEQSIKRAICNTYPGKDLSSYQVDLVSRKVSCMYGPTK